MLNDAQETVWDAARNLYSNHKNKDQPDRMQSVKAEQILEEVPGIKFNG
jgi:hypothetical protein